MDLQSVAKEKSSELTYDSRGRLNSTRYIAKRTLARISQEHGPRAAASLVFNSVDLLLSQSNWRDSSSGPLSIYLKLGVDILVKGREVAIRDVIGVQRFVDDHFFSKTYTALKSLIQEHGLPSPIQTFQRTPNSIWKRLGLEGPPSGLKAQVALSALRDANGGAFPKDIAFRLLDGDERLPRQVIVRNIQFFTPKHSTRRFSVTREPVPLKSRKVKRGTWQELSFVRFTQWPFTFLNLMERGVKGDLLSVYGIPRLLPAQRLLLRDHLYDKGRPPLEILRSLLDPGGVIREIGVSVHQAQAYVLANYYSLRPIWYPS